MITLALDTALGACSVAVVSGETVPVALSEPMTRGHQERLAPMAREAAARAGVAFAALDRIGCTVGPGSFTGLRVGLAFARALALALDRPCVGIGSLEALAASVGDEAGGALVVAAIEARGGQLYIQAFTDGAALTAPDLLDTPVAAARLAELGSGGPAWLVGPGAASLDGVIAGAHLDPRPAPDPVALARLAAARPAPTAMPRPLYLRAPDARTLAERASARRGAADGR